MFDKIASIVKPFAPAIASALTGNVPGAVAGAAIALKQTFFGKSDVSDDELFQAVQHMTPEHRIALRQADIEMARIEADAEMLRLNAEVADKASARTMQTTNRSNVPAILTFVLTIMVGYTFTLLCFTDIDADVKIVLEIFATQMLTAWLASVTFWFGSTYSSQIKTTLLGKS